MKAWKITCINHRDDVFTELCTRWNDVLYFKTNYEVLEMVEVIL